MARNKHHTLKKHSLLSDHLTEAVAVAALIICCVVLIITIEVDCAQKKADLVQLNQKVSSLQAQNMEIQRVLDNNDMSEYMEKVALEDQGYAFPDERRFYDTSRD